MHAHPRRQRRSTARCGPRRPRPGQGRFLNDEDVGERRRVVFLGSEVARKLFGEQPAVGQTIRIAGRPFEVVGVMEDKVQMSSYFSPDKPSACSSPTRRWRSCTDTQYVDTAVFQSVDPMQQTSRDPPGAGRARQAAALQPGRRARPQHQRLGREHAADHGGITIGLKVVLSFIGVLTLAIGGVGVMNIMFVSVTERTREIGIRKALGAKRREILLQFLLEGMAITTLGGHGRCRAVWPADLRSSARGRSSPSCSTT